jgi:hypothetical protein
VIVPLAKNDARLVAVLSTFMVSHPYPVTSEYIWSHLLKIDPSIIKEDVSAPTFPNPAPIFGCIVEKTTHW